LGAISDAQFVAATERAGVGTFLRAAPTTSGLFGQNVFVTTSVGEFVLRGAPHYVSTTPQTSAPPYVRNDLWQFTKEVSFARMLHERTNAPIPWPQWLDESSDIFGWPYIIMPKMPGTCFDDRSIRRTLSRQEQLAVARALGETLAEQQRLVWPFAGDFDPMITLVAYPGGQIGHLVRETSIFANAARAHSRLSPDDDTWMERIFSDASSVPPNGRSNVYVHGDFKFGNLTLERDGDRWRVSGVFDLHESRFGDGASDLCRQLCTYIDHREDNAAQEFLSAYRQRTSDDPTIKDRMPLYIVNDRMKFWEYFTRPEVDAPWLAGKTFQGWAQSYIDRTIELL
jgi:aminoglycoside phosphotransferase (APT) family kinase protein